MVGVNSNGKQSWSEQLLYSLDGVLDNSKQKLGSTVY
jgi:hypothetical protein